MSTIGIAAGPEGSLYAELGVSADSAELEQPLPMVVGRSSEAWVLQFLSSTTGDYQDEHVPPY
jgi:hypothetical protein